MSILFGSTLLFTEDATHAYSKTENTVLTLTKTPETSMHISWKTVPPIKSTIVQVVEATDAAKFNSVNVQLFRGRSVLTQGSTGKFYHHKVLVKNLTGSTKYLYRVGDGDKNWSTPSSFTTAQKDTESFSFLFGTDTQAYSVKTYDYWRRVLALGTNTYPTASFIVHAGDIVDDGKDFREWQYFLNASQQAFSSLPFMAVMGNHDVYGNGERTFKTLFPYPLTSPKGMEGYTYFFDYGNARFIMLNTEFGANNMRSQVKWLETQVKAAGNRWTIVVMHRSPYASNPLGGGSGNAKSIFTPVFERLGVDLVLSGHDHAYMRTKPMKNGAPSKDGTGTRYIIGGSAGPKFYPAKAHAYTKKLYDTDVQIISNITVERNQLKGEVINLNGKIVDKFAIIKN